jgi:hypothetical protein
MVEELDERIRVDTGAVGVGVAFEQLQLQLGNVALAESNNTAQVRLRFEKLRWCLSFCESEDLGLYLENVICRIRESLGERLPE